MECLNCNGTFAAVDRFCPACGQATSIRRLNLKHILSEVAHAFTHADKGVFFLVKELAIRPGHVAREYVDGKRKKYFNPFNFLLLTGAIFAFFTVHFHSLDPTGNNPVSQFLSHYSNVVLILGVPLLSLFSWALFRRSNKNYSENLVLNAFLVAEINLFYDIVITPVMSFFTGHYVLIIYIYFAIWLLYYIYASTYFFDQKNIRGGLTAVLVIACYQFFSGFIAFTIYYGYLLLEKHI